MQMPPGGPMEVVFSLDTTGSMSQALDEVKARVIDIVQRLQADIPGFRVGVVMHGDYCDAVHFYDIRTLDITDNLPDLAQFVNDTGGTGGGDVPECYELALRHIRSMTWRPTSRRVLVVIGDAYPHAADSPANVKAIDWEEELAQLVKMGIIVYGVQVGSDPESTEFFSKLVRTSGGQHLRLDNMNVICDVIMGICYREQGAEFFQNYEAEVRAMKINVDRDLDCVLGTLRREESRASDMAVDDVTSTTHDFHDVMKVHGNSSTDDAGSSSMLSAGTLTTTPMVTNKRKRKLKTTSDVLAAGAKKVKKTASDAKPKPSSKAEKKPVKKNKPQASKSSKDNKMSPKSKTPSRRRVPTKDHAPLKPKRESVIPETFAFNNLSWSDWTIAVASKAEKLHTTGHWKSVAQCCAEEYRLNFFDAQSRWCDVLPLWRTDLLQGCAQQFNPDTSAGMVLELAIKSRDSPDLKVVYGKFTAARPAARSGVFNSPWYSGMFRSIRPLINRAVCRRCKVYIRWAPVDSKHAGRAIFQKVYDYSWRPRARDGQAIGYRGPYGACYIRARDVL